MGRRLLSVAVAAVLVPMLGVPGPSGAGPAKGHMVIDGQTVCEIHYASYPQKVKETSPTTCDGAADLVGVTDNGTKSDDFVETGNVATWFQDPSKPLLNFSFYNYWYYEPAGFAVHFGNAHFQIGFAIVSGPHAGEPACLHGTLEYMGIGPEGFWTIPAKKPVKGGDVPQTHVHLAQCDNYHKDSQPNQVACPPSPPGPQHGVAQVSFLWKQVPPNSKPGTADVTILARNLHIAC